MGFFIKENNTENSVSNDMQSNRFEIDILAIGKKIGVSFEEMNELSVQDFIDLAQSFLGEKDKKREATQQDIDKFFM